VSIQVRHPRPQIPYGPHLVVGLARSGVAAALALRARGEDVIGVDARAPIGTGPLLDAGVELHLQEEGVALLEGVRAVVKSPGVSSRAPVIVAARERGLPVLGELELAWRMLANEFIAVTGTNGKTTTVELIGHIHREAGLAVAIAGNVGTAACSLAGSLDPGATVVCEVSSFQLEDTSCFAPEAAVLLNVTPDHLDRHETMEAYLAAKLEIFARQGREDIAVVPTSLLARVEEQRAGDGSSIPDGSLGLGCGRMIGFGLDSRADLSERAGELWWQQQPLLAVGEVRLRGRHNRLNAMAAAAVCLARGVGDEAVRGGLRSFAGVPHRLEEVACPAGVLYVNDSKATNVASTLVALDAFAQGGEDPGRMRIHLILGGQGKDQDFTPLAAAVERSCREVYLIGEDAAAIADALTGTKTPLHECGTLERALLRAKRTAARGDVVLLSPACASFDQFANFEARGERFRELLGNGGFEP
jgi:UDP-N-acetylmuramoylalanine--D-glutamate ligase